MAGVAGSRAFGNLAPLLAEAAAPTGPSPSWRGLFAAGALAVGACGTAVSAASPREERSFIMVKPDGVQRGLVADVIARFERKGYKLVGIKVVVPSEGLAGEHYAEHRERPFFPSLVGFLSSGPVVAMVWEGKGVIAAGRAMIGATNPLASAPGTIRGDFGVDVGRNIIHGSDGTESAQREIGLWFKASELAEYTPRREPDVYE